ncbi:hypothetical protein V8F33_011274 [Rhypophila sp. PSN 637]
MPSETTSIECEAFTSNIELTNVRLEEPSSTSTPTEDDAVSAPSISPRVTATAEHSGHKLCFRFHRFYEKIQSKTWLLGKLILVFSIIITAVAVWPTFAGAAASKRSNVLAEWTARKDYFEFCESVVTAQRIIDTVKGDCLTSEI